MTLLAIALSPAGCRSKGAAQGDGGADLASASEGGGAGGSCRVFSPGKHVLATCIDYVGAEYTSESAPSVCTTNVRSGPSEYSPEPCPTADRVGSCELNPGTSLATIWRSYPAAGSGNDATGCKAAGGAWKAR